jgi:ferredoxin--NADP+ reductase
VREVHVFARRGPAQAKFTPLELRELDHSPNVEVLVNPEDIEYDDGSVAAINSDNQTKLVVRELEKYAMRTADKGEGERPRKLWLHFFESPVEIVGDGKVEAFRTERTELDGTATSRAPASSRLAGAGGLPLRRLPLHRAARPALGQPQPRGAARRRRVLDLDGTPLPGVYVNGWVKRGPVGLIGHTKGDAIETVGSMLEDLETLPRPSSPSRLRCSSSSSRAGCSGRPGTAGSCSTRTSRRSARRTAWSASRRGTASRWWTARR